MLTCPISMIPQVINQAIFPFISYHFPVMTHASVNISRYKHKNKCAKVVHIAYQPISAEIYLLAAYSTLAQKYHVHYMHVGQHIFCLALCIPADIYVGALLVIQLTYIISHI